MWDSVYVNVGPVNWGSYPGETLEIVMAVLVAQDHPNAIRRTPSSGDGGVDLLIPLVDGWHVRQVKGFQGRMTPGRKRQVEESFAASIADPRLDAPIVRWDLTVPIDPTSGEQEWYERLTADAPFDCGWNGETFWHGLAAKHPHVIDYYLRDGRGRVETSLMQLLALSGPPDSDVPAMLAYLEVLGDRLNLEDPHYTYGFWTGPPSTSPVPGESTVLTVSQALSPGRAAGVVVSERYVGSSADAPITASINLLVSDPETGLNLHDAVESFMTYGHRLSAPAGTLDVVIDAPAGLGCDIRGAGGTLGPILAVDPPDRTRLRVTNGSGELTGEVVLHTRETTVGPRGGISYVGGDADGLLTVRFLIGERDSTGGGSVDMSMAYEDLIGTPVMSAYAVVRLRAALSAGSNISWLEQFGTNELVSYEIPVDLDPIDPLLLEHLENLALIQSRVRGTMTVEQDLDHREVAEIATLLRHGEVQRAWSDVLIHLSDDADPEAITEQLTSGSRLVIGGTYTLVTASGSYAIGEVHQILPAVKVSRVASDPSVLKLEPDGDDTCIVRLGKPSRS